ncbi:MAG: Glycosyl transferase family 2 [candidate division WWE3 bacterium GW2011_GWA1_41_8]|uniref:Glycosyl transferase family 2 n=2 Tax=Katanobacteria TaxID=422282 RepID=A0A0G0XED6_UNCKA|nr:MAG: Glycosyl transferase family 2 [candidate division WWE3 bacterium GW2011_GWB1_41_6]KKS22807.1 MAG: Glycosyl transferase family 2 [candidate division WWE3 bacterium GW2011_GWA1_41_8]
MRTSIIIKMPFLSIVIINYNTRDLLQKCLVNLLSIYPEKEIIVVDNGSSDGSAEMVRNEFNEVLLIETTNNGLAAGSNLGLERSRGDYVLYMGTDAYPTSETVSGMIEYMEENNNVGISTAKLVLRDGTVDMDAHRGFPTPWAAFTHFTKINKIFPDSRFFNRYFLGGLDMKQPHEIDLCIAHFMFIRRVVFDRIGKWDEQFFLYGEDVDFCYRTKEAGFKIMYLPQFSVLHYKGVTVGIRKQTTDISTASQETRKKMKKETTRAMRLFYDKHYKNKYPKWLTGIVLFGIESLSRLREKGFFLG